MPDKLGSAQWEAPQAVSRQYPYTEGKFWLGRNEEGSPLGYRDDRHICLVSGSRGGKFVSVIANNLCLWPGSAFVIDGKAENANVTAARRGQGDKYCAGLGQAVHVLDPFMVADVDEIYRSSFNPFDALDPNSDETIDEATRLANAIVVVKPDAHDPFWDESARSMVRGIILHVLTADQFMPEERNLIMVRNLILRGEWQLAERMREHGIEEEKIGSPHRLLWRTMEANPAFDGLISGIGSRFLSMMGSEKQFEGILQAVTVHTEFLDSPGMRRCLERSDFRLSELKTRPEGMTLYLCLPQRYMDTHYRWLRMMVALTTTQMEITRGNPATGHPVLMVLDEFAGLKRMEVIENAVAQIAGFGVKLFFVLQSLEQLKGTYKDHWETFLANAGLKIFFSIEDHFTREYVSKLVGETEIIREMQSETQSRADSVSRSDGSSRTDTTSESKTDGSSSSHTDSASQSTNTSRTKGSNKSSSFNEGASYEDSWFFGRYYFNGHVSSGNTAGFSTSTSRGETDGTSRSDARGKSSSDTSGTSRATGISQTTTQGSTRTAGTGRSETVHRRPLIQPDEVGRVFARLDDEDDPRYPGLALVLVTGANPLVVRRTNYFQDLEFMDCFSPHPDHKFLAPACYTVSGIRPLINHLEDISRKRLTIAKWFIKTGEIGQVERPNQTAAAIEHVPPDNRTISIYIPYSGKVTQTAAVPQNLLPSGDYAIPESPLFTIKNYPDAPQQFSGIDPFAELREALNALAKHEHAAREREEALHQSAKAAEHAGWAQVFGFGIFTLALELIAFRIARGLTNPWENFGFFVVLLVIFVTGNILITRSCPKNRQGLLVIIRLLTFGGAFAAFTVHLAVDPPPSIPTHTHTQKHMRQPKS